MNPAPAREAARAARVSRLHPFPRAGKRYIVLQVLPHTLGVANATWRLLDRCHRERNGTEYEGLSDRDEKPLAGLVDAARELLERIKDLPDAEESAE